MSIDLNIEEGLRRIVEEEYTRYMYYATKRLRNVILGNIYGGVNRFRQAYGFEPVVEVIDNSTGDTIEIVVTARFSEETREKVKKIIEKSIREKFTGTRLRIKALHALVKSELKSATGGLSAVLHNYGKSSSEGYDKAGGGGEEVRNQEGGFNNQSTDEASL